MDEGLHDRIKFIQPELCLPCNAGLFVALGVNWGFGVARDLVFGVLARFSSDFVNFHLISNFDFDFRSFLALLIFDLCS